MNRNPDWAKQLPDKIKDYMNKPFQWGTADCCVFICDCVIATTGIDPMEQHRGRYKTAIGAAKAQKNYGSIEESLDRYFDRIMPKMVQRGDVCTHKLEDGTISVAVFWAGGWWCMTDEGCRKVSLEPIYTWKVENGK
ncbi:MAG: hypothetical protein AB7F25_07095 [Deferribacterales bacterium]